MDSNYDPIHELHSDDTVDRYAAVKALVRRDDLAAHRVISLESVIASESDERVLLEAAGGAAALGSARGEARLAQFIWNNDDRPELRMEAVLILTELGDTPFARDQLRRIVDSERFRDDEVRQAAVWGLGKTGLRRYDLLVRFIDDHEDDVALHAIAGFDHKTPPNIINRLVCDLAFPGQRRPPAASAALCVIGTDEAIAALTAAASATPNDWILATLGRMPPDRVRHLLAGDPLLERVAPLLLTAEGAHWLASEENATDIRFLLAQDIS